MKISHTHLNHILAARVKIYNIVPVLIHPYEIKDEEVSLNWYMSAGYCTLPLVDINVIKDYGVRTKSIKQKTVIVSDFLKRNYPVKPITPIPTNDKNYFNGFIAPNGDYYHVLYGNHTAIARSIVLTLEDTLMDGIDAHRYLEPEWLWLRDTSQVHGRLDTFDFTREQETTIKYIDDTYGTNFIEDCKYRQYAWTKIIK